LLYLNKIVIGLFLDGWVILVEVAKLIAMKVQKLHYSYVKFHEQYAECLQNILRNGNHSRNSRTIR